MGDRAEKRLGWIILAVAAAAIIGLAVTMTALNSRPQLADRPSPPIPRSSAPPSPAATSSSPTPTPVTEVLQTRYPAPATSSPAADHLPSEAPAPPAPAPRRVQPAPVPEPLPAWSTPVCPTGRITARVDRVDAKLVWDWGSYYELALHGTVTNATTETITVASTDSPSVQALDKTGKDLIPYPIPYVVGEYDQTPPAGKPRASELVLAPGASATFTATVNSVESAELKAVQYWYTDTAYPSVMNAYFADDNLYMCDVGREAAGTGHSLPNPYR